MSDKWLPVFIVVAVVSVILALAVLAGYQMHLKHEKFIKCMETPRCEWSEGKNND